MAGADNQPTAIGMTRTSFIPMFSLRWKLLFCFILIFLPLYTGFSVWLHRHFENDARYRTQADLLVIMRQTLDGINGDLFTEQMDAAGKFDEPSISADLVQGPLRAWLKQVHGFHPRAYPYIYAAPQGGHQSLSALGITYAFATPNRNGNSALVSKIRSPLRPLPEKLPAALRIDWNVFSTSVGDWVSVHAPIQNRDGFVVGAVGIDYDYRPVQHFLDGMRWRFMVGGGVIGAIMMVWLLLLSRWQIQRIYRMTEAVDRLITPGYRSIDLSDKVVPLQSSTDEWGGLSNALLFLNQRVFYEMVLLEKTIANLRITEKYFKEVLANSRDILFRLNIDSGVYDYISDALQTLTGFSLEEIREMGHKGVETLIHPEDLQQYQQRFSRALICSANDDQIRHTIVYRLRCKDGTYRWFSDSHAVVREGDGEAVIFIGTKRDITEQKHAEMALKEAHERFLTVLDSIDAMIHVVDMESHEILFMNKRMQDAFGGNFTGGKCWRTLRAESGPCQGCTNGQLLDHDGKPTGVCVWEGKNPVLDKWFLNQDRAIKWIDGRWVRLEVATDITPIKAMEQERRRIEAQSRRSQKLEAVGTLAGGIAHDFNNILTSVIGFTELAMEEADRESVLFENLHEVLKAGHRARDLVRQILTFSRQTEQEFKPVQIKLILKEALKLMRATLPSTIEIQQRLDSHAAVLADPTQIHQLIMNLCTNAGYAMRESGGILKVELLAFLLDQSFSELFPELDVGDYLCLTVSDTGRGISQAILDRIFDPYFTTKPAGEGTGLGLAMAQGIVKNHGGIINVTSEPGEGAVFTVYLPVIKRYENHTVIAESAALGGDESILFVDDEPSLLNFARQMMEQLGYRITTRLSSMEALELFKANPNRFDLVITDLTMPNLTGDKFAKELMNLRPDLPIVLCTGYSEMLTQEKAAEIGIRAFVMKPLIKKELAETIRQVLDNPRLHMPTTLV